MVNGQGGAAPVEMVDIGGRRLAVEIRGEGTPGVVLESALATAMRTWDDIAPALAAETQVLRYDRAGVGQSDPAPTPRSAHGMVEELQALLLAVNIAPPYVLVGHSVGALVARLYASHRPADVAGLVLLEATHEGGFQELRATLPPPARDELDRWLTGNTEGVDLELSCRQVREAAALPHVPYVVVTATGYQGTRPGVTEEEAEKVQRDWLQYQADLAGRIPGGRHVLAERSGHAVQRDQPDLVVETIRSVVRAVQTRG